MILPIRTLADSDYAAARLSEGLRRAVMSQLQTPFTMALSVLIPTVFFLLLIGCSLLYATRLADRYVHVWPRHYTPRLSLAPLCACRHVATPPLLVKDLFCATPRQMHTVAADPTLHGMAGLEPLPAEAAEPSFISAPTPPSVPGGSHLLVLTHCHPSCGATAPAVTAETVLTKRAGPVILDLRADPRWLSRAQPSAVSLFPSTPHYDCFSATACARSRSSNHLNLAGARTT